MQTVYNLDIQESETGITRINFTDRRAGTECQALIQLKEYLKGERQAFSLKLDPEGTKFQLKVWRALQTITYGQTTTYQEIANKIGQPSAVRAVANAIGANPIAIIIPCHRVILSDASLGGYRWGAEVKQELLKLESANKKPEKV